MASSESYNVWRQAHATAIENARNKLPTEIRQFLDGKHNCKLYKDLYTYLAKGGAPSKFINKNMGAIFGGLLNENGWIDKKYKNDLLWAVDNCTKWQYSSSIWRRSFRSSSYTAYLQSNFILSQLENYARLGWLESSLEDALMGNLTENENQYFYKDGFSLPISTLLAAHLDAGDSKVFAALKHVIMDNGTNISLEIIRGVMMSSNADAHNLICQLLVAARLQEGMRQAICESADSGTIEGLRAVVETIKAHDLIRFSAVKRAIFTWCGIFADKPESIDRIAGKMLDLIAECLADRAARDAYLESEDAMQIYIALWAYSAEDARVGAQICRKLAMSESRHRRMVAGIFASQFENPDLENELGKFALENFADDTECLAVYFYHFMPDINMALNNVASDNRQGPYEREKKEPPKSRVYADLSDYFESRDEAEKFRGILLKTHELFTPKKKEFDFTPCVFPWISVKLKRMDVAAKLCWIASALQDNTLIDEACGMLAEVDSDIRNRVLRMLVTFPETDIQRDTLVNAIADKESYTRSLAIKMVENIELTDDNYLMLENMLRLKNSETRTAAIELLEKLDDERLYGVCERLLADKNGEKRAAGLDMVLRLKKQPERAELFARTKALAAAMQSDISREKILLDQILDEGNFELPADCGLYKLENCKIAPIDKQFVDDSNKVFCRYFPESELAGSDKNADKANCAVALKKLDALLDAHKNDEFTNYWGETKLLGNAHSLIISHSPKKICFEELWDEFYQTEIGSPELLLRMYIKLKAYRKMDKYVTFKKAGKAAAARLFGADLANPIDVHFLCKDIVQYLYDKFVPMDDRRKIAISAANWLYTLDDKTLKVKISGEEGVQQSYGRHGREFDPEHRSLLDQVQIDTVLNWLFEMENNEFFAKMIDVKTALTDRLDGLAGMYFGDYEEQSVYALDAPTADELVRACAMGVINDDEMYRRLVNSDDLGDVLSALSGHIKTIRERDKLVAARSRWNMGGNSNLRGLIGNHDMDKLTEIDKNVIVKAEDVYNKFIGVVLGEELNRGDSETRFSPYITSIKRIYGVENYVKILAALGKETFVRGYIYGSQSSKKETLSHLISVCVPNEGDTAEKLRELVSGTDITEKRLIEAAMYSPEWLNITADYLGWEGFKSGCCYFMAHMNESYSDKITALIAKYTPISVEDLQNGAFDIKWFKDAYATLGEKRFAMLYDAAKYISDGAKHSRARKYADAVLGKLDPEEAKTAASVKRNKDMLMAYSLIPCNDDEIMQKYLFIQQFLKESKKFGAQRRASEAAAAEIAMQNLALSAGSSDVMRLKLRMESELFESIRPLFEPKNVGEVSVWLEIRDGKTEIACEKGGKRLKNVPAKLKKDEYIVKLTETRKQLTDQYRRTRTMLEQSMEDSTVFTLSEIVGLMKNDSVKPLLENLVYCFDGKCGVLKDGRLCTVGGEEICADGTNELRIAHPFDMYADGSWRDIQKYLFDDQIVQPFRQVFRELYIKTAEELENCETPRFAGNQILVKKTVATLRGRRWVCDLEDGLQKVYYKENIVAKLYALADWFSPSDIEAPTLEHVSFSDRVTGKPIKIKDIPDIIFSEVMRDADLAVSVCHAGEVDPEHSHSTIEMRAAILEFTLPLFKLKNCEVKGSHVLINGTRADYSVHLGSGICHIQGGAALNIMPVHSQHRGRVFLPFADDDPKTAEIISKVLLLAEDKKIKDPFILDQIH